MLKVSSDWQSPALKTTRFPSVRPSLKTRSTLAGQLAALVRAGVLRDVLPLPAKRIPVADEHFGVGACVVNPVRINPLLDQRVAVFLAEVRATDAAPLEVWAW